MESGLQRLSSILGNLCDFLLIGFLLQGGFGEASQLRCCESYLETLPSLLGCEYNGTLLKGDMFAVSFLDGKIRKQLVEPFYNMGKYYAQNNYFNKEVVNDVFLMPLPPAIL